MMMIIDQNLSQKKKMKKVKNGIKIAILKKKKK